MTSRARLRIALLFYAAILSEGLMLAAIGPTLGALADQTGSTLGQISILFTAISLGYILGSLAGGRGYARVSGNRLLALTLVAMAAAVATIPLLSSRWGLIGVFTGIGVGIGLVDVGCNTLTVWLFRRDVAPYMNALHLSFGVGAFLAPLVIDRFAVATGSAVAGYWLLTALMIPVAVGLARAPSPEAPPAAQESGGFARRYRSFVGLLGLFFFLHVGGELAFGGWIFSYAEALDIGADTTARVLNAVFWGGLVVGRLLAIPLSLRLSPGAMLRVDLLGAAASLGLVALLPGWTTSLWIGTFGFGLAIASMFASSLNYAEERMPITSLVTAVFLVGASLGSMTLPWVVGQLFEARGPDSMVLVVGGAVLGAILLFGIIGSYARRRDLRSPAVT